MKTLIFALALLAVPATSRAATQEFTILGDQKIKAEVKKGVPLPAEKNGVRIEAAAFRTGGDGLEFGFMLTTRRAPSKIVVEDVSGSHPVLMVEDLAPVLKKDLWLGVAKAMPITAAAVPWLFERGSTSKVFRFTVTLADTKEVLVLLQPAVYSADAKQVITGSQNAKKG